jgi:hypothetical protein
MVVDLPRLAGKWHAAIVGDSLPLRPSRARRRAGLQLDWQSDSAGFVVIAGTPLPLEVLLPNTNECRWTGWAWARPTSLTSCCRMSRHGKDTAL